MKAADIQMAGAPPHVLTLGPKSFSSRWKGRPTEPVRIGLRIASAEERVSAGAQATARACVLLPRVPASDPRWKATFEVCWIHYLLGMVLTSPNDVNAPWSDAQDGTVMLADADPADGGDAAAVSTWFTDEGIARLWDEYEALTIKHSEVWPELPPDAAKRLGNRLADGSFFADLDTAATAGNGEAREVAAQLRRLLSYVVDLRTNGRQSAVG